MAVETTTFSNNSADTWFRDIMFDCVLCPRACHVNRLAGQTGYCGQTAELMAARASLHYWEEPCISGSPCRKSHPHMPCYGKHPHSAPDASHRFP